MCLIALACHAVPGFPLVLLANRDEQYARPRAPVDWWDDPPGILGGRDLQAGGGWLAIHRDGRLAAVTNVRDGRRYAGRRSRGELVTHFLTSEGPLTDFTGWLSRHGGDFAPFNLVFGRVDALYVYHSPTRELRRLTRGIHGISKRRGFTFTTRRDKRQSPASDLVNRRFHATGQSQLWAADMT